MNATGQISMSIARPEYRTHSLSSTMNAALSPRARFELLFSLTITKGRNKTSYDALACLCGELINTPNRARGGAHAFIVELRRASCIPAGQYLIRY